ncbi:MAG: hypothetical protein IPN36_14795 [Bacteroidetes bacterium]|nr:hypothetical protein [Bacteroidota bacterium]
MKKLIVFTILIFIGSNAFTEPNIPPTTEIRYDVKIVLTKIQAVKVDEGLKLGDNEGRFMGAGVSRPI